MKTTQQKLCKNKDSLYYIKTIRDKGNVLTMLGSENHQVTPIFISKERNRILKDVLCEMVGWRRKSESGFSPKQQSSVQKINQTHHNIFNSTPAQPHSSTTTYGTITYDNPDSLDRRKKRSILSSKFPVKKRASSKKHGLVQLTNHLTHVKPIAEKQKREQIKIKSRVLHDKVHRQQTNISTPSSFDEQYTFVRKGVSECKTSTTQRIKLRRDSPIFNKKDILKPWLQNQEVYIFSNGLLGPSKCISDLLD